MSEAPGFPASPQLGILASVPGVQGVADDRDISLQQPNRVVAISPGCFEIGEVTNKTSPNLSR